MPITHAFHSEKEDGADPTLLQPSYFNAAHVDTNTIADPGQEWAAEHAYALGERVKDPALLVGESGVAVFECVVAGTSGLTIPEWWVGGYVTDGTAAWLYIGQIGGLDCRLSAPPVAYAHDGNASAGPYACADGAGSADAVPVAEAYGAGSASAGPYARTYGAGDAYAISNAYGGATSGTIANGFKAKRDGTEVSVIAEVTASAATLTINDGTHVGDAGQVLTSDGTHAAWAAPAAAGVALLPDPGQEWAAEHAYALGERVKDPALLVGEAGVAVFEVVVAGTSDVAIPGWWVGGYTTDGTAAWLYIGVIGGPDCRLAAIPVAYAHDGDAYATPSATTDGDGGAYASPSAHTHGAGNAAAIPYAKAYGSGNAYAGPYAHTDGAGSAFAGTEASADGAGSAYAGSEAHTHGAGSADASPTAFAYGTGSAYADPRASAHGDGEAWAGPAAYTEGSGAAHAGPGATSMGTGNAYADSYAEGGATSGTIKNGFTADRNGTVVSVIAEVTSGGGTLAINDGSGVGTAGQVLTSDGTHSAWAAAGVALLPDPGQEWEATTAVSLGYRILDATFGVFEVVMAGTTGGSDPFSNWDTTDRLAVDGTVGWMFIGRVGQLSALSVPNPSASSTGDDWADAGSVVRAFGSGSATARTFARSADGDASAGPYAHTDGVGGADAGPYARADGAGSASAGPYAEAFGTGDAYANSYAEGGATSGTIKNGFTADRNGTVVSVIAEVTSGGGTLAINDGSGVGTAGQVLTSDGTHSAWAASGLLPDPGQEWAAEHAYALGERVKDPATVVGEAGVAVFEVVVAGTSDVVNPFGWDLGYTIDGTAAWFFIGQIGGLDCRLSAPPMAYAHDERAVAGTYALTDGAGSATASPTATTLGAGDAYARAYADARSTGDAHADSYAIGGGTSGHVRNGFTAYRDGTEVSVIAEVTASAATLAINDGTDTGALGEFLGSDGDGHVVYTYPPGYEFDYVANTTTTVNVTATTEATADTIITGSAVAYDGSTIVMIEFFTPACDNASGQPLRVFLYDGASSLGQIAMYLPLSGVEYFSMNAKVRLTPSNATHTYSIRAMVASGTGHFYFGAGGSGTYNPGFIRITKV